MIELNDFLTKKENLMRLELNQYFPIEPELEDSWRQGINNFYNDIGKDKVFSVRTKRGITVVIRTK